VSQNLPAVWGDFGQENKGKYDFQMWLNKEKYEQKTKVTSLQNKLFGPLKSSIGKIGL